LQDLVLSFIDDKQTFRFETFTINAQEVEQLEKDIVATYREILTLKAFDHTRDSFDKGCQVCQLFQELV